MRARPQLRRRHLLSNTSTSQGILSYMYAHCTGMIRNTVLGEKHLFLYKQDYDLIYIPEGSSMASMTHAPSSLTIILNYDIRENWNWNVPVMKMKRDRQTHVWHFQRPHLLGCKSMIHQKWGLEPNLLMTLEDCGRPTLTTGTTIKRLEKFYTKRKRRIYIFYF